MTDSEGLSAAYERADGVYVDAHRMFIAGTKSLRDVVDDMFIPVGGIWLTRRYRDARNALNRNPHVTELIGHSLGGAVANELSRRRQMTARLYAAPVADLSLFATHEATLLDPIAGWTATRRRARPGSFDIHTHRNIRRARLTY